MPNAAMTRAVIRVRATDAAPLDDRILHTGWAVWVEPCRLPGHIPGHMLAFHGTHGTVESAFVAKDARGWVAVCYAVQLPEGLNVFPAQFVHRPLRFAPVHSRYKEP